MFRNEGRINTESERESQTAGSGLRILLVEDHDDTREALSLLLELDGHEVVTARDGREALSVGLKLHPDVVITDFDMPNMDGAGLARELRRAESQIGHVPILVVTALNRSLIESAMEAGADAHITKPVDFDVLKQTL